MRMVLVPGGPFFMGSDRGSHDERPRHQVEIGAFLIDVHEVTNAQFSRFVQSTGHETVGPWRRGFGPGQDQLPVRFVTWHDARDYAAWAGRRLPTEAQWEKAARGESGRTYPWGDSFEPERACIDREVAAGPMPVGSFASGASPSGCLDLCGNVWEWVADWYDRCAYESRSKRPALRDPTGPADGEPPEPRFVASGTAGGNERSTRKVIRGGGWVSPGWDTGRTSRRSWGNPGYWFNDTGFRCVIPLTPGNP
jgi:formylglycine-generating enzyme required for sulfatase activity